MFGSCTVCDFGITTRLTFYGEIWYVDFFTLGENSVMLCVMCATWLVYTTPPPPPHSQRGVRTQDQLS